jgi:hypothetical protein
MFAGVGWVRELPTKLTAIQTALAPEAAALVAKARALLILIHLLAPVEQWAVLQRAVTTAVVAAIKHIANDLLGLLHVRVFQ